MTKLHVMPEKIIITDDGGISDEKNRIYEKFRKLLPLQVIELEFDAGLSRGRNVAFQNTDTPYVLLIDDDHYLSSNIYELVEVLKENPHLGGVTPFWEENGQVFSEAADIQLGKWVVKRVMNEKPLKRTTSGIGYYEYDFVSNSCLFRRECLLDYPWDDFFIINMEHADFYLTHKKMGKWSFAVSPDYLIQHDPGSENIDFIKHRKSKLKLIKSMDYLLEKHQISGFIYDGSILTKKRTFIEKINQYISKRLLPRHLMWYWTYQRYKSMKIE